MNGKGLSADLQPVSFVSHGSPWMVLAPGAVNMVAGRRQGRSAQEEFGLTDPGQALIALIRNDLNREYHMTVGHDYKLQVTSKSWAVNNCMLDHCQTSKQFWYIADIQLDRASDGSMLASRTCMYRGFVDPDKLWNDNAGAVKEQIRNAAEYCRKDFISWVGGGS